MRGQKHQRISYMSKENPFYLVNPVMFFFREVVFAQNLSYISNDKCGKIQKPWLLKNSTIISLGGHSVAIPVTTLEFNPAVVLSLAG